MLSEQSHEFDLHIWNNNYDSAEELKEILINANMQANVVDSRNNIGGIGRFFLAEEVHELYDKIVFIDDDQDFDSDLILEMDKQHSPKTVCSWSSWKINSKFEDKTRIIAGGNVDYCGTGGMILDASAFTNINLLIPPTEFMFVEDLWLSCVLKYESNFQLRGIPLNIRMTDDGKNQYESLYEIKNVFWDFLKVKYGIANKKPLV